MLERKDYQSGYMVFPFISSFVDKGAGYSNDGELAKRELFVL